MVIKLVVSLGPLERMMSISASVQKLLVVLMACNTCMRLYVPHVFICFTEAVSLVSQTLVVAHVIVGKG